MGMMSEFREFISRGNVVDLAVGVVIGAAFGNIVTSFVDDIIMPLVGLLIGGIDFSDWVITLVPPGPDPATEPGSALAIGNLVNVTLQFLIIAFAIFLVVKAINSLRRQQAAEPEAAAPTPTEALLAEIRDTLKASAPRPAASKPAAKK